MDTNVSRLEQLLEDLRSNDLLRSLQTCESAPGPFVTVHGRRLINCSSNNYLALATHPALREASARAVAQYGCSAGASRLVTGTLPLHVRVEQQLAQFVGAEAALLFSSGYAANVGIVPALAGAGDDIFSDAHNHASIIDGCRLSRATVSVYPHSDMMALERMLARRNAPGERIIISESLFGMDGDLAPLNELADLAQRYEAILLIDEAHALGVVGRGGRGYGDACGLAGRCLLLGTLGKAFGSAGAFVAGPARTIEYLTNSCRSFIYSTAPPPAVLGAIEAAIPLVQAADSERRRLLEHTAHLRHGLRQLGFTAPPCGQHIVPVIVGEAGAALAWSQVLVDAGVLAIPIRPPTVPEGTSRLRLALSAAHTSDDVERVLAAFTTLANMLASVPEALENRLAPTTTASSE